MSSLWGELVLACVAASVTHLVSMKVFGVAMPSFAGFFAVVWKSAMVAVIGMEMVIDMAAKVGRTVKPGAGTNEDSTAKPLGAVIAIGGAAVRGGIVVAVGAFRRDANVDADLGLGFWSAYGKAETSDSGCC
jgi:hypothetical protein